MPRCFLLLVLIGLVFNPASKLHSQEQPYMTVFDISHDESRYAAGYNDYIVRIWNHETRELLAETQPFIFSWMTEEDLRRWRIQDIAFNLGGEFVAVSFGSYEIHIGVVLIVDAQTGETVKEIHANGYAGAVDWSMDNRLAVLSSSNYGTQGMSTYLDVFDVNGNALIDTIQGGASNLAIEWSPDASKLAYSSGYSDSVLDTRDWSEFQRFQYPDENIVTTSLAWNSTGDRLAGIDNYGTITIWNVISGELTARFPHSQLEHGIKTIDWNSSDQHLAYSIGKSVEVLRIEDGEVVFSIQTGFVAGLKWRANDTLFYSAGGSLHTLSPFDASSE